jgi:hypothetical protein
VIKGEQPIVRKTTKKTRGIEIVLAAAYENAIAILK